MNLTTLLILSFIVFANASPKSDDIKKQLSFFNVVKFPDDECDADNGKTGTCLSKESCEDKDGVASGDCAEGYGVCCVISLGCGDTASNNITHIELSGTSLDTDCTIKICKAKDAICRIKFDFTTFDIAPQETGTVSDTATASTDGGSIGKCLNDGFSIASPGNKASPVICGFNTGQHMFMDAPSTMGGCVEANFRFGSTNYNRKVEIKVLQYQCGAEMGGPPDCLQYFTSSDGSVANYGFPTGAADVAATTSHLVDQFYTICWRRNDNKCALCFTPKITTGTQNSFGLSISKTADAADSDVSGPCDTDFLTIPFATANKAIAAKPNTRERGEADRHCGRFFAEDDEKTAATTVCTGFRPFQMTVHFDETEVTIGATSNTNELRKFPGGIVGFFLTYTQVDCST